MAQNIKIIALPLFPGMGKVNCYLVRTEKGQILIDTGGSKARKALLGELVSAGYTPGSLKLVILTHGDFDHSGNAAYLRSLFGVKVAMHPDDAGMVEKGDMFVNRNKPKWLIKVLVPLITGFGRGERFTPDRFVDDGYDLTPHGLEAKVIHLPGHSKGSIGILTEYGDLFCGDLLENTKTPALNVLMDDLKAASASLEKLETLKIGTVYPGHGEPFEMADMAMGMQQLGKPK